MPPFNSSLPYSVYSADPTNAGGGGGGSQDLDQTLTNGDDANNQNIVNLQQLVFVNNASNKILDSATGMNIQTAGLLDVTGGDMEIQGSADTIKVSENTIGVTTGSNPLVLYSDNTTTADSVTEVDALAKLVSSSTLVSLPPNTFDAPNGTNQDGFYKIQLRRGMDLWSGVAPFSRQNTFGSVQTEFPTGQIVEYQNKRPIQYPAILSRVATGVEVVPATTYVISLYGVYNGGAFEDRMIYDPLGMRAFINPTNGWTTAGAPSLFRGSDVKCLMRCKWNFKGRWSGPSAQNRAEIYINQYRNGALLRAFQVAISNNDDTCVINGERTFIGFHSAYGEDFDCSTDWYEFEVANMSPANNVSADYAHTEVEFILAQ
jgi:hypothetical protein